MRKSEIMDKLKEAGFTLFRNGQKHMIYSNGKERIVISHGKWVSRRSLLAFRSRMRQIMNQKEKNADANA